MKKATNLVFLYVSLLIFLFSCGSTKSRITSFKDPAYKGKKYDVIMISASLQDLGHNTSAEQIIAKRFNTITLTRAVPAHKILLPTRQYDNEQVKKIMEENRIKAVLFVNMLSTDKNSSYKPPTTITNFYNNTAYSTPIGGKTITTTKATFDVTLQDAINDSTAWKASVASETKKKKEFENIYRDMAKKIVKDLMNNNLVEVPIRNTMKSH